MSLVYYLLDASRRTQRVKIGITTNLSQRLVALKTQTISRQPPIVLALEQGGQRIEAERHHQFAEFRLSGEWFRYSWSSPLTGWISALENPVAFLLDREQLWPYAGGWAGVPLYGTRFGDEDTTEATVEEVLVPGDRPGKAAHRILDYLSADQADGRTGVIAARLNLPIGTVGSALRALAEAGRVIDVKRGQWSLVEQESESA